MLSYELASFLDPPPRKATRLDTYLVVPSLKRGDQVLTLLLHLGLAGLATAYALQSVGHTVRVFEKQPSLGAPAGGLRVPPNMRKILKSWVGEEELRKTAVLCVGTPWHDRKSSCGAITPELDFATGGYSRYR